MDARHRYGWRPDLPDRRDWKIRYNRGVARADLAVKVSLRSQMPAITSQGFLGACTSHTVLALLGHSQLQLSNNLLFNPSAMFVYYNTRILERTVQVDSGSSIRNAIKSLAIYGVCDEFHWPYVIERFKLKPNKRCYRQALDKSSLFYRRVPQTLTDLRTCLHNGLPVAFGFSVYESFESAEVKKTGIIPVPRSLERCVGGHATVLTGYDDTTQTFEVRNSYGTEWGDKGYGQMHYSYITDSSLSDDFWTMNLVEDRGCSCLVE